MTERIDKALTKLEAKEQSVPQDERVAENPDYTRLLQVIRTLRDFKAKLLSVEKMLDHLGV